MTMKDVPAVDLELEGDRATKMLSGKSIKSIKRHHPGEVLIEFTDGTRLFIDAKAEVLELSIGGSPDNDE
ncbi:hypothetical protein OIU35_32240 [Boseaceae bacterium BT-24-1]|nr:hypothetical protein [Boseaceae bacterium BT-24-1]